MKQETEVTTNKTSQMVVFKISDEIFATDINSVREVIKFETLTPVPDSHDYVTGIVNIRGKIVPVIDLGIILKIVTKSRASDESYILLIDGPDNGMIGMLVDEVAEIRYFNIDEIKPAPKLVKSKVESEFISGVILPEKDTDDGSVILFVDLEAIINKSIAQVIDQVKSTQAKVDVNNKEETL
jgi:purine-binding chemotaxis protein CheW